MKILQVIPFFSPRFGGDVNVCYNLSKYLAKKTIKLSFGQNLYNLTFRIIESERIIWQKKL